MSKKQVNTENIVAAAQGVAGGDVQPTAVAVAEAVPAAPPPRFILGDEAPEGVVAELHEDRIVRIDPDFVSVETGFNLRDFSAKENQERLFGSETSDGRLEGGMVSDLLENGQANPIKVRIDRSEEYGTRIVVVAGETRLRAIRAIREAHGASAFPAIAVLLAPDKTEAERTIEQVVENNGKTFSMLEMLGAVNRLRAEGYNASEMGRRLNLTHTAVRNLTILDRATPRMKDFIRDGWLSPSYVIERLAKLAPAYEAEAVGLLEKTLAATVAKRIAEGKRAAKGVSSSAEKGEPDGRTTEAREAANKGPIFNKGTFNGAIVLLQELYAVTSPREWKDSPDEKARRAMAKQRKSIATYLESVKAPTVNPAAKKVAEEVAAIEDKGGEA